MNHADETRTAAEIRHGRWPGWIWAVPIAALGITTWLALRAATTGGVDITIQFSDAAGMRPGNTSVEYLGVAIGKVTKLSLNADGRSVKAKVNIDDSARKYLRTHTQFWLEGSSPSLSDLGSLKAIVAGPTIVMNPADGEPSRQFVGLDHRPALLQPHGTLFPYVMYFDGSVGQLKIGAPVTLRGFTVGAVQRIDIRYDERTNTLETPIIVVLDPARFGLTKSQPPQTHLHSMLNSVLLQLTKEGLRGRLVQEPPVIGSYAVALDFVPGAPNAELQKAGKSFQIPTISNGGFGSIVNRVNAVPIDKIAEHVLIITERLQTLVSSPQLQDSLVQLDKTLRDMRNTVQRTGPQITELVKSLRAAGAELDRTAYTANNVLGGNPENQDENIRATLYELTDTARAVRSLADYLDRHPEAFIKGKPRQ
jgi:paraquat-inducible protein B